MAQFYNKTLRNEEELGGFNPGEPDDDIFKIGNSNYPGDISEFLIPEPVVENITPEPEINIDEFKDTFKESTIWDDFEEEKPVEPEPENENLLQTMNLKRDLNIPENFEKEHIEASNVPIANISQTDNNNVTIDDEFKQKLSARIRPEKVTSKEEIPVEPMDSNFNPKDFKPVEEIASTDFIDISKFDISRASEKPVNEILPENKTNKPEEPKKEKKSSPFILFGIIAASIIILTAIAFTIYNYVYLKHKNNINITKIDSTKKDFKKEIKKTEPTKPIIDSSKITKKIDSVKVISPLVTTPEKKDSISTKVIVEKKPEKEQVKKKDIPSYIKIEKKPIIEKPKKVITEKKIEVKKSKEKVAIAVPKKVEKKPQPLKEKKNKKESKPKAQTEIISKTDITTKIAVYTVQVYSSPSKEDALEWIRKLKDKNISDAFISEQMVRDVKWYRVRFGQYESREQARSAALRYGFAQTWIDRVK